MTWTAETTVTGKAALSGLFWTQQPKICLRRPLTGSEELGAARTMACKSGALQTTCSDLAQEPGADQRTPNGPYSALQ
jgi:hypothetical protein